MPDLKISEMTDYTTPLPADLFTIVDTANATTKKITYTNLKAGLLKFGGTGADGALSVTSGTTTIDCANAQYVIKNYTSISITSTGVLGFSNPHANGTIVILKSQGAVTITSSTVPCVDTRSMGAAANTDGTGMFLRGVASSVSAGGLQWSPVHTIAQMVTNKAIYAACGSGGGNARSGNSPGGRGGGGLYIECGGALNFTGTINTSGTIGGTGTGESGGGGGGSAGLCVICYNSLTANSGTITATGGAGSAGINVSAGTGDGGAGAGGFGGAGGTGADAGAGGGAAGTGAGGGGGSTAGGNQAGGSGGATTGGLVFLNTGFV